MTSKEILEKYFDFFVARGHKKVPNVSLVPEGDSTLLFVNSGMFPLVPYLSGQPHPLGKRLVNVQRAGRFQEDLTQVGDPRHTTVFHMIGNWSLGDYFKKEQLPWIYEFFVEALGLPADKLYATVFAGDTNAPKDNESIEIIKKVFSKYGIAAEEGKRIFPCDASKNWWQRSDSVGELGGPDSEIYYYLGENSPEGKNPTTNEDEFLEIGNSVFMQYIKTKSGWKELLQKNVDFGGGLERIALAVQGKKDIFETDNFWPLIQKIEELSGKKYGSSQAITKNMRVIADHIRGCVFLAMDGVIPYKKGQGSTLRGLLSRMVTASRSLGVEKDLSVRLLPTVSKMFSWLYPNLPSKVGQIKQIFKGEEERFYTALEHSESPSVSPSPSPKDVDPAKHAQQAFDLYQSKGLPREIYLERRKNEGCVIDETKFQEAFNGLSNKHKEISRAGMEKKFKGGLADSSEIVTKYHTTTHLMQKALRQVLSDQVSQLGSNITNERLRFDFPHTGKLSEEEITQVEKIVNEMVEKKLPVNFVMLPKEVAIKSGTLYIKHESYPDMVKVYFIGDNLEKAISKEFCGGPHVKNTSELKPIEIYKQESIGEGKMRVYARFKW
jgi:alanyl-tRNA synthetase